MSNLKSVVNCDSENEDTSTARRRRKDTEKYCSDTFPVKRKSKKNTVVNTAQGPAQHVKLIQRRRKTWVFHKMVMHLCVKNGYLVLIGYTFKGDEKPCN